MPAPWTSPVAKSIPFDNTDNGFEADECQSAIEEARDSVTGRLLYPLGFGRNGVILNAYLFSFYNVSSEDSPAIIPANAELLYTTFANQNIVNDVNIYVYRVDENVENQTLIATLNVTNLRTKLSSPYSGINIPAGYGLQVRVEKVSGATGPSNPAVILYLRSA